MTYILELFVEEVTVHNAHSRANFSSSNDSLQSQASVAYWAIEVLIKHKDIFNSSSIKK